MRILCSNPKAQYTSHRSEIHDAILNVLDKGHYILGEQVKLFEKEFAQYLGVRFAVGVASGTEALHIALKASGIGKGDEVITVSHTAVATVSAIELSGTNPVLVDVEPDYFTMDYTKLKKAITKRTKAIIPVHIYGQPAELEPILKIARKYGIKVIEDCSQAHGAVYKGRRVGAWGDLACFSFYPTKNLGAIGDGGMIVTNSKILAEKCRLIREYGWKKRYVSKTVGWNSRLDELQAAILRVKLRYLDKDNLCRRRIADGYAESLSGLKLILPKERKNSKHVYHLYVIRIKQRDKLREYLRKKNIQALIHYPVPIHLQPAYKGRLKIVGELIETERIAREVLSLPIYPELTKSELQAVITAVQAFYG